MRTHPYSKPFRSDTDEKIFKESYFIMSISKTWDSSEDWIVVFYDERRIRISGFEVCKFFESVKKHGSLEAARRLYKEKSSPKA